MIYRLYTLMLYLILPVVLLQLARRRYQGRHGLWRWRERFGDCQIADSARPVIWIHAVSVGEAQATRPLVDFLEARYPAHQVMMTTVTATGAATVRSLYGDRVVHHFAPYDLPFAIRRLLERVRPVLLIIMETEIWPNLYRHCHARGIPILLVNARLSDRSCRGYRKLPGFIRQVLANVTCIAAQSDADSQRFESLGVERQRIIRMGNLKFDQAISPDIIKQGQLLRDRCGERPIWVAASTHEGEERQIMDILNAVRREIPGVLLVLAPRHPERGDAVARLIGEQGLTFTRYSTGQTALAEADVHLLDTLGQLMPWYAAATVAFVGGSLIDHGGHNPLEPVVAGTAVITGPYAGNFREIIARLEQAHGLVRVADAGQLAQVVVRLLGDPGARGQLVKNARAVVAANQGSMQRLAELIGDTLPTDTVGKARSPAVSPAPQSSH